MKAGALRAWLRGDLAGALYLVLAGWALGLVVNAYSPHGINMSLAMDWWPFGG